MFFFNYFKSISIVFLLIILYLMVSFPNWLSLVFNVLNIGEKFEESKLVFAFSILTGFEISNARHRYDGVVLH